MSYVARHMGWALALGFGSLAILSLVSCNDNSKPTSPPLERSDPLVLNLARGAWTLASHPVQSTAPIGDPARAKLLWHNPLGGVRITDVWDRDVKQGEGIINTFRMIYRPRQKLVNHNSNRAATDTIRTDSWAGIMTYFTGIGTTDVQHFEMRVKGAHGRMHFDFGRINEDVNGDFRANTEDGCTDPSLKNGRLDAQEDIGLDGLPDYLEAGYDPLTNPDPSGDNWFSQGVGKCPRPNGVCNDADFGDPNSPLYYEYLNGTEGNIKDLASGSKPDEEGLSQTGFNTIDSYFSFVVDLADTLPGSFYVPSSYRNGWKTYLIPIKNSAALDTTIVSGGIYPDWRDMTHVRVWFNAGPTQAVPDTAEIAEWRFTKD